MHNATVAHGSKQEGKGEVDAEDACAQVAILERNRMTRAECDLLKCAAVLAQRDLALRPTVQIIENRFGHPTTRNRPEVFDADNARRRDCAMGSSHLQFQYPGFIKTVR
jgi:hypothetical protein